MTTPTIHPIVLEKLQRFSRQRRRLIVWRGLCGTLAVWFGAMMVVALVDRLVLIPDDLRMALSVAGYVATAVMFWVECGRYLIHRPDARELARLMELAAPQLREELLSAVELSETEQQPHWDSDEFRAALQQAAARDVGGLQIEGLLTKKLIAGWFKAALVVVVVLAALLCVPGLRFTQSFARAVLPAANLARYSSVEITVIAPTPPDQIIPEGDNVPVTVSVSGADVQQVILETIPQRGPRERIPMSLSAVNQFAAAVQLNQTPVEFRIRARDAITRKYTLTPRPRPHVVRFHKTYHYPAYSGLPARTVTEENGDLDALEGTELELNLEVDQPIKEASLQIATGTGKTTKTNIPLESAPGGRLIARLPLTAPGTYQTHLVAAQTSFENKYSPQYEIRVRPDLIPSVKIDRPDREQLVLPPDSVVNLAGTAKDDLALASVVQAIQVNRGEWKTFPLAQTTNTEVKVARTWELFELGVTAGDRVLTKLIATDRKGQRGESAPVRILIATADFDPDRLKNLKERQALNQSIHDLREAADQVDAKTREARIVFNNPAADAVQKKQALLAVVTTTAAGNRKADDVLRQLKETIPHATDRESADLALVGSAISRAKHEGLDAVQAAMERATDHTNAGDDKAAKNDLEKVLEPLATVGLARLADDTHRQMLAAAEANTGVRDLQNLATEQRALNDQLRTATNNLAQAERIAHRQTVAANQVKAIEEQMKTLGEHTWGNPATVAHNNESNLAGSRANLEKALSAEPTAESLKLPSEQMQRSVDTATTNLRAAERELAQRADTARKTLQDQTGTAADAIAKLADQLQRRDSPAPKEEAWQAAADQLKDRAALEERRPRANAQFAATAGHTADALQTLQDAAGKEPPSTNTVATVKAIEQAFRKLQTGHALDEQVAALRELAAEERWERATTPAEAADRANDWKWAQQQMQSLPQQIERAQLPKEARLAIETAGRSQPAQQVENEMNQRRSDPTSAKDVAEPLAKLAGDVTEAKQQLQPALDQARAEIEKRAPAVSDRLAGLSQAAEKLNRDTAAQAQQAEKPENAKQVQAEAQKLATAQQHLDKRLDDVKDTLRRDANAQNLGAEEGRARARDADDALAMLSKPRPSANELLQHAANTEQPAQQQADLKSAAEQQAKLAADLKQLAEHYQNTEDGHPEATRTALRETEKELGLKPTLDAEYAKAQALEKLAGLSPEQQLAELEKTLPDNKAMRSELSDIAKDALQNAAADLQKSANQEQQLAQQLGLPAEQAKRIADEAQKLAQQSIPAITQKADETAKPDLNNAGQKLAGVAQDIPQDFSKPPEQLAKAVQDQIAPLQQAATDLNEAANKLGEAATAAAQQAQQAKTDKASPETIKQAEAAAQQAQAAKQQAQQAGQQAGQLARQATELAKALEQAQPPPPLTAAQQAAIEQAKHLAEAVQQLAQQDVPAVAEKAGPTGETAKPDLAKAGQKLEDVARNIPEDLSKRPEQLAQIVANQALPLQQAANDLNNAANRLGEAATAAEQKAATAAKQAEQAKTNNAGEPAIKQAEAAQQQAQAAAQQVQAAKQQAQQASQKADQLAQQANQMAGALKQAPTASQQAAIEQAKALAEAVQKLAKQDVSSVAQQAGETAKPDLTNAGQKLEGVAKNIPQESSKPAEQLIQAMQNQVAPLQQAANDLNNAAKKLGEAAAIAQQQAAAAEKQAARAKATKAGESAVKQAETAQQQAQAAAQQAQAAQQQAQKAGQQAGQLAQQAGQVAKVLDQARPPTASQQAALEQAKRIAADAQKLAQQNIPSMAEKAGEAVKPDLAKAGQKLDEVAKSMPQDFSKPTEQVAQAVQNQVAPLQQAATDLNKAAKKLGEAAATAQQQATTAARQAQHAKANKASTPEAVAQAEATAQQAQAAAQQAQASHQQAQQASQQAGQLAQQAGQAAAALSQPRPATPTPIAPPAPTPMQAAAAQQPAIEQAVREAGSDIERAGRHEARLGQEATGQQLEQLGKQVGQQTGDQIAQVQPALAQAADLAQAQRAAQTAEDAIKSPLNQLTAAIQQPPPSSSHPAASPDAPSQLAAVPEAAAKWMARALDSLDAELNAPAPTTSQPAQASQAPPSAKAGQPAQNAAALAAAAAAQAQSSTMMSARANGLAPGQQPIAQGGSPGGGAAVAEEKELPTVKPTAGNWGKLPPKLARDLMDSQHEGVGGEYREMVDMYYRAIADKAREKQQP